MTATELLKALDEDSPLRRRVLDVMLEEETAYDEQHADGTLYDVVAAVRKALEAKGGAS